MYTFYVPAAQQAVSQFLHFYSQSNVKLNPSGIQFAANILLHYIYIFALTRNSAISHSATPVASFPVLKDNKQCSSFKNNMTF